MHETESGDSYGKSEESVHSEYSASTQILVKDLVFTYETKIRRFVLCKIV
ncbi:hypothetical protein GCM10007140_27900 [Priestia taiwanensis]|uniref:Uncharacterized protein n=1 Tax=Priestia taiwanensis TaxID=1347902 RepID=A0A917AUC2_9BACI|nr:hypothetical protein GCM10007140_27900 [Priestia taiwanensis]